jgi:hypothetical protein
LIPSNKTALQRLIETREQHNVQDEGANPEALRELLLLLHAPDTLSGGVMVARTLRRIFVTALRGKSRERDRDRITQYLRALRWFCHNADDLAQELFDDQNERERFLRSEGKNPLIHHGAEKHGLWCLLWAAHAERKMQPSFLELQLQAVLAHISVLRYWTAREEWRQRKHPVDAILKGIYRETLAIRHFVMPEYSQAANHRNVLAALPIGATRLEMFAHLKDACAKYKPVNYGHPAPIFKDLISILWLLHRASAPEIFCTRPKDSTAMPDSVDADSGAIEIEQEAVPSDEDEFELDHSLNDEEDEYSDDTDSDNEDEDDEDDEDDSPADPGIFVTTRRKWNDADVKTCIESGLHPEDLLPAHSILLSHSNAGHRGTRAWAEMDNQLLSWSRNNLPIEMAAQGMNILKCAAESGGVQDLELYARASVILRTAATEAMVKSMVVRSEPPYESEVKNITLVLPTTPETAGRLGEWLVPALPLPFRSTAAVKYDGCRECVLSFALPDYSGAGGLMRRLLDLKTGGTWNGEPICPFDRNAVEYQRELRECLRRNAPAGTETLQALFTFSRLGTLHFQRIYDLTIGNAVPATYITQRKHRTGEVPRFYETPGVELLQLLDKRSIATIDDELKAVGFDWEMDQNIKPSCSGGYVGSPYCPTASALRDYLSELRRELIDTHHGHDNRSLSAGRLLLKVHNLFTVYSYVGYNIATCHRAVESGYTDFQRIEPHSRMMTLKDKGTRERLVAVADVVWTQMRTYRNYVLGSDFELLLGERPRLPIFLLSDEWTTKEISPSSLRPYLPFPANFGRHYVRTSLAERIYEGECGLSAEYLNEFLGHATEGEDRAGPYSAFDYRAYANVMRECINGLLKEIEYWPINFFGKRLSEFDSHVERI